MEDQNLQPVQPQAPASPTEPSVQAPQPVQASQSQTGSQAPVPGQIPASPASEAEQGKLWGILGYIFGFLFFVPLVNELKNNQFSRFHANQQLILFIAIIVKWIAFRVLHVTVWSFGFFAGLGVWWLLSLISTCLSLVFLVFAILGIINAAKGEMKPLPIIGGIKIL